MSLILDRSISLDSTFKEVPQYAGSERTKEKKGR
jgi:hypothetical protein